MLYIHFYIATFRSRIVHTCYLCDSAVELKWKILYTCYTQSKAASWNKKCMTNENEEKKGPEATLYIVHANSKHPKLDGNEKKNTKKSMWYRSKMMRVRYACLRAESMLTVFICTECFWFFFFGYHKLSSYGIG